MPQPARHAISAGPELVKRIQSEVDFIPVVRTAVTDLGIASPQAALAALDGFVQWVSLVPISDRVTRYVMLRGDVDRIWHAAIIETAFYRDLCDRYVGRFVDHHGSSDCPRVSWVLETVDLIESMFGADMHPEFARWRQLAAADAARHRSRQAGAVAVSRAGRRG